MSHLSERTSVTGRGESLLIWWFNWFIFLWSFKEILARWSVCRWARMCFSLKRDTM